jgi:polysaccharide pyruvyl transferase WcaK-like protein
MAMNEPLRVCMMGASTDTGNLGVSALCLSVVGGILLRAPDAVVTVFDEQRGEGPQTERFDGRTFTYRRCGLYSTRRYYRRESLWNVQMSSRLGGLGNPASKALRESDAVVDITGGDSFTDLYGPRRFENGRAEKMLALEHGGGLILLPQTYGPFDDDAMRGEAARIIRAASMAWARDAASFETLRKLLGDAFDPERHRCGVDVAFRLGANDPGDALPPELRRWFGAQRDAPTVGFNVSGLTYINDAFTRREYGLAADYRATVHGILERLLARTSARIVLVPHVLTPPGHYESDRAASLAALEALGPAAKDRVLVAPDLSASQVKWLIARTDWFCGTRMHSTIAALSSGVPCAALAYSLKTHGVFETCGQGGHVAELRRLDAAAAVDAAWRSWETRDDARRTLAAELPRVLDSADRQMDAIVAECRRLGASRRGARAKSSA